MREGQSLWLVSAALFQSGSAVGSPPVHLSLPGQYSKLQCSWRDESAKYVLLNVFF